MGVHYFTIYFDVAEYGCPLFSFAIFLQQMLRNMGVHYFSHHHSLEAAQASSFGDGG